MGFTDDLLDVDGLFEHRWWAGPRRAHCSHTQEELVSQRQVPHGLLSHHHGPGVHRHPLRGSLSAELQHVALESQPPQALRRLPAHGHRAVTHILHGQQQRGTGHVFTGRCSFSGCGGCRGCGGSCLRGRLWRGGTPGRLRCCPVSGGLCGGCLGRLRASVLRTTGGGLRGGFFRHCRAGWGRAGCSGQGSAGRVWASRVPGTPRSRLI